MAVSGLPSVLARFKGTCNLTGKCFEMPNVSYTQPLQASLKDDIARNGNLAIHRSFKTT